MIEGTHILFVPIDNANRKTLIWQILTKNRDFLGTVKWFGRWRKYCFFPAPDCVFEEVCMREISQFIVDHTKAHKDNKG